MIGALVLKDFKLFFRNQFFAVITVLGIVVYVAIYLLLPTEIADGFNIAVFIEAPEATQIDELLTDAFKYTPFTSESEMLTALEAEDSEYLVGVSISSEQAAAIANGEQTELSAYYAPSIPAETKQAYGDLLVIIMNSATPDAAALSSRLGGESEILGNNIYEAPIAVRDRIIPLFLLFILAVEVLGLATLIMREVENGTARALITGPLRLHEFFASKAIMGMLLAFGQVLILVAVTGKLSTSPLLILATLLLGSFLIVGIGFFVAAISKDNMSVLAWGMLIIILFAIPGISVMLPGLATGWIEAIPSFFFVDSLHRILNFEAGWADVGRNLSTLFVIGSGTLLVGAAVLRRRF